MIKKKLVNLAEIVTEPLLVNLPINLIPKGLARLHKLNSPTATKPNSTPLPIGGSNINIIFTLLEKTLLISGDWAECGVYFGGTVIATGLWSKARGVDVKIWGFDSFEGLPETSELDKKVLTEDASTWGHQKGGYRGHSYDRLSKKIHRLKLDTIIQLVPGYFENSLMKAKDNRFSFVHLDCDLYTSYKTCLEFFYPRMNSGGIILFDEYNDPPWPGCNKAIDEFMLNKPEKLHSITMNNQIKYYIRKD